MYLSNEDTLTCGHLGKQDIHVHVFGCPKYPILTPSSVLGQRDSTVHVCVHTYNDTCMHVYMYTAVKVHYVMYMYILTVAISHIRSVLSSDAETKYLES